MSELVYNCRSTLRGLARICNLSAPSVKKRIAKFQAREGLSGPYIELSLAMLDAEYCNAWLTTDGSEHNQEFLDQLGTHPTIRCVGRVNSKRLHAISEVVGSEGLSELGRFFRSFGCVTGVDIGLIHPVASRRPLPSESKRYRGRKLTFSTPQLSVIECLWDDARMPTKEIARRTRLSSRRVKQDIRDMGDTTGTIMGLRPVRFHYKAHGSSGPEQYGLVAEEVAAVAPDLVARNGDGEIETVFYDKVNAMLLNEVQKQHGQIQKLQERLQSQEELIRKLEFRLTQLEGQVR